VSRALADRLGWQYLSTDVRRKELLGVPADQHLEEAYGDGVYDATARDRTYTSLLSSAAEALSLGESVVLDATWASKAHRDRAVRTAARAAAELTCLQTVLPDEVADVRIRERGDRGGDASDADVQVARELRTRFDPWTAHELDTSGPSSDVVEDAVRLVAG
jgi:predicted kinase